MNPGTTVVRRREEAAAGEDGSCRHKAVVFGALIVAGLVASAASWASPGAPTVTVRAEKLRVALGEPFRVWVSVLHPPDLKVVIPSRLPEGSAFEELKDHSSSEAAEPDGLMRTTFDLTVAGFLLGAQAFPALTVGYGAGGDVGEVMTDAFEMHVTSVVGDAPAELKPVSPPVMVYRRDLTLLWVLGLCAGFVLAACTVLHFVRRGRRSRTSVLAPLGPVPIRAPEDVALEKLRELGTSYLLGHDDRRPVYFVLTEIVREFLGKRLGFDALELTSRELLDRLDRTVEGFVARAELAAWLEACDLVKYARVPASRGDALRAIQEAVAIVERTRPEPVPMTAGEAVG